MKCRESEALLQDIASQRGPISAGAAAHLAACPRCWSLLERERRLTASLAVLAAGPLETEHSAASESEREGAMTSPALETRLRAAYREHWREKEGAGQGLGIESAVQAPARSRSVWPGAAAAIVIASLGVMLLEWNTRRFAIEPPDHSANLAASQASAPVPEATELKAPESQPAPVPASTAAAREPGTPPASEVTLQAASADPRPAKASREDASANVEQAARQARSDFVPPFVPLFYGGDPLLAGGGQVWRVEMPRAALQTFGMPLVEESSTGHVQVDIMLGEDGIARAIRFVQ